MDERPPAGGSRGKVFFDIFNAERDVFHRSPLYPFERRETRPRGWEKGAEKLNRIAVILESRYNFAHRLARTYGSPKDSFRSKFEAGAGGNSPNVNGEGARSMSSTISERSVVVAVKDQVSCDLAGEAAILNIKSGVYYGLDPVGARIWSLMQEPRAVAQIQEAITGEYDVEPDRCARDLIALLEKLFEEGLIEVKDDTPA